MTTNRFTPRKSRKPKPPKPTSHVDAILWHLEGRWPPRKLTTLEWAVLVFMSLGMGEEIHEDYSPSLGELGLVGTTHSHTYGAEFTPARVNEWCGLYPNTVDYPRSLFHVFPYPEGPKADQAFNFARRTMEGLLRMFLVERHTSDTQYGTYRLTPFGCMYLGPIVRALSEPTP